jgi:uncharacterized membrane protein
MDKGRKMQLLKLENWFLILALVFGLIFAFLVPPNQVPDEDRHFARVYAILEGNLTSKDVDMPRALYRLLPDYYTMPEHAEKFNINSYLLNFSDESDYSEMRVFSPAASYSPLLYFPQLVGVGLGKILGLNAQGLFVLGRIFSLFLFVGVGYFVLKTSPVAKKTLFIFLTMPMNIYIAASYSADTVQLCITLIYLNMVMLSLSSLNPLTRREWIVFLVLAFLLSLTKPVSLSLVLLSLAIPVARFGSLQKKILFVAVQLGIAAVFTYAWTRGIATNLSPTLEQVAPLKQLAYIILNPIHFITTFFNTLSVDLDFYFYTFVGYFGWLTTPLPNFVYLLFLIVLLIAFFGDTNKPFTLTQQQKYIFFGVLFLYILGFMFIMYLYSTPLAAEKIVGVQGRYFIPVFPILLYLIVSLDVPVFRFSPQLEKIAFGFLVPVILFFSVVTIYQKFFVICGEQYFTYEGICRLPGNLQPERPIGEILRPVTQTFTVECKDINGVGAYFATYGRDNSGLIQVTLRDETSDTTLVEEKVKVADMKDNRWIFFRFPTAQNVNGHTFALTFVPEGSFEGNAVTIWATRSDIYPQGEVVGLENEGDIVFQYECPYGLLRDFR